VAQGMVSKETTKDLGSSWCEEIAQYAQDYLFTRKSVLIIFCFSGAFIYNRNKTKAAHPDKIAIGPFNSMLQIWI